MLRRVATKWLQSGWLQRLRSALKIRIAERAAAGPAAEPGVSLGADLGAGSGGGLATDTAIEPAIGPATDLETELRRAMDGARGLLVLVSPNPMHDTGGGQRSAQLALEFLERGWAVLFLSHGEVTETVELDLTFDALRLVERPLGQLAALGGRRILVRWLARILQAEPVPVLGVVQVPVPEALPLLRALREVGVAVYDCIDEWDSELGWGWYRRGTERRFARTADFGTASAPVLQTQLERLGASAVHALPNAFNPRIFDSQRTWPRPGDLPPGDAVLYVGSLWGGWMHWALVERIARRRSELNFVFIGDHRGEGDGLPPNCHFLGLKPQHSLPAYLQHARVGWLPWRVDAVTRATSPLKVYEYLAMGLPVVGPAVEPLLGIPGVLPVVAPAAGTTAACTTATATATATAPGMITDPEPAPETEGYEAALERVWSGWPDSEERAQIATFARDNGWPARVGRLLELAGLG